MCVRFLHVPLSTRCRRLGWCTHDREVASSNAVVGSLGSDHRVIFPAPLERCSRGHCSVAQQSAITLLATGLEPTTFWAGTQSANLLNHTPPWLSSVLHMLLSHTSAKGKKNAKVDQKGAVGKVTGKKITKIISLGKKKPSTDEQTSSAEEDVPTCGRRPWESLRRVCSPNLVFGEPPDSPCTGT